MRTIESNQSCCIFLRLLFQCHSHKNIRAKGRFSYIDIALDIKTQSHFNLNLFKLYIIAQFFDSSDNGLTGSQEHWFYFANRRINPLRDTTGERLRFISYNINLDECPIC